MSETKKHTKKGQITRETAKEMQKKSREAAVRNRKWREYVKALGKMEITMQMPDGSKQKTTWDGAVVVSAYRLAIAGDDKARKFIGMLNGQLDEPTLKVEAKVKHERDMSPEEAADFIAQLKQRI
jgi:hypothetical protein